MNDYQYDYEWDNTYCYPNSFVLKNKLGITTSEALNIAEREITSMRMGELSVYPVKGLFDLKHLQNFHRFLFQDVYPWAGQLRTVDIAKGNMFCNSMFIQEQASDVFTKLKKEDYLIGCPADYIPERLAYYLSEINAIHPFREGNGRTQRAFLENLAQVAGFSVNFSNITDHEMVEASADAFQCDYGKMNTIFQRITTPVPLEEQENSIANITPPGSDFINLFHFQTVSEPEQEEEPELSLD